MLVHADDSVSIAIADPMYWELEDFKCFSGKLWELIQAVGSKSLF